MIVDLFAGPGGWSEGLRALGLSDVGIELDPWACATRAAAGHSTIRADVATYPIRPGLKADGLIASPPCPAFSRAGRRHVGDERGQADLPHLLDFVARSVDGWNDPHGETWVDPQSVLSIEVLRWVEAIRPEWVALEQVPEVLPLWQAIARVLEARGYSTWVGVLNAADFGVPQTRRRAVLIASTTGRPAHPTPTHSSNPGLFGETPWVSMREALGWEWVDRRTSYRNGKPTVSVISGDRPAPTLTANSLRSQWLVKAGETVRPHTHAEGALIQGFPDDYPFQGPKRERGTQIGNAVPPVLAAAVLREAGALAFVTPTR